MPLAPCPQCHRHVRSQASACPFCGGGTALVLPTRRWVASSSRYTRVAIFAGVALVGACAGEAEEPAAAAPEQVEAPADEALDEETAAPGAMMPMAPAEPALEAVEPTEVSPTAVDDSIGSAEDEDEEEAQADPDRQDRRRRRRVEDVILEAPVERLDEWQHIPRPPYGAPPMWDDAPV